MSSPTQLSPGAARVVGALTVLVSFAPILIGLGVFVPAQPDRDASPPWVLVCAGLMFVAAGLAVALAYGIGAGIGPDGDLPAATLPSLRAANLLLGLTILGLMTAVFGWIAFEPGPRRFSMTVSLPFLPATVTQQAGDALGRVVFGDPTLLLAAMFVVGCFVGVQQLRQVRRNRWNAVS